MIALAEEHTIRTKAWPHKARVFNQDAVKAYDFIQGKLGPSGVHHGSAPTLQPVARRALPFYFKTRAVIGQQKESGGARDKMPAEQHGPSCVRSSSTIDPLTHELVAAQLTPSGQVEAIVNALRKARMRIPPHQIEFIVKLIGEENAAMCNSIPRKVGPWAENLNPNALPSSDKIAMGRSHRDLR